MSIQENLNKILKQIEGLNLPPHRSIEIVSACKAQPIQKIEEAVSAGVNAFGANYVNEFLLQKKELQQNLNWHFIGSLQSNKLKNIVGEVSLIHSVSRFSTLTKINKLAKEKKIIQEVLLQLNLSGEDTKSGFNESDLFDSFEEALALSSVRVSGLMTMPPVGAGEFYFKKLAQIKETLNDQFNPGLPIEKLSMGTSDDYLQAIQAGATHIRLGTVLMGRRSYQ